MFVQCSGNLSEMPRYSTHLIRYVQHLRVLGNTYNEIQSIVGKKFAKGTLSDWCRHLPLSPEFREKVRVLNQRSWLKARKVSQFNRNKRREEIIQKVTKLNEPIANRINDPEIAKIALAMLCLGEASKSKDGKARPFCLGNSDPRIIILFLSLLYKLFHVSSDKIRCTVQCRADQDIEFLMNFWIEKTKIPREQFYKARVDPRTIGKPTLHKNYMGVLKVDVLQSGIQFDLESLSQMVYNQVLVKWGPSYTGSILLAGSQEKGVRLPSGPQGIGR